MIVKPSEAIELYCYGSSTPPFYNCLASKCIHWRDSERYQGEGFCAKNRLVKDDYAEYEAQYEEDELP